MARSLSIRLLSLSFVAGALPLQAQVSLMERTLPSSVDARGIKTGGVGDVDADGTPDFATGLAYRDGRVLVHSGRDGRLLHDIPGTPGSSLGSALCGVGDVDRDGHDDFLVGAVDAQPAGPSSGRALLFSGRTGALIRQYDGDGRGDLFGAALAQVGDVDGDGVEDFAVGAPENGEPIGFYGPGYARVFSGATLDEIYTFEGIRTADEFGASLCGAGDINGDGHAEVAVCAFLEDAQQRGAGAVTIFDGATGQAVERWYGARHSDHFGISVTNIGDVDGDGYDELAMGAVNIWSAQPGAVYIRSTKTGQTLHKIDGGSGQAMFGFSIAPAGDVDGDGSGDVLVGDPGYDFGSGRSGGTFLISGRTGTVSVAFEGANAGAFSGRVGSVGDLDHDGRPEFAATARSEQRNGNTQGVIRIMSFSTEVSTFGTGCGPLAAPELDTTAARAGGVFTAMMSRAAPAAAGALLVSNTPNLPMPLGSGCTLYLDAATAVELAVLRTDASGRWSQSWLLPLDPNLIDRRLAMQALVIGARGPELTQGVYLSVRR